jgi:hypothetical protein
MILSPVAPRVVAGLFAADMARHEPELARQFGTAVGEQDLEKGVETGLGLAANTVLAGTAGAHAIAPRIKATSSTLIPEPKTPVEEPIQPDVLKVLEDLDGGKSAETFLNEAEVPTSGESAPPAPMEDPAVVKLREELGQLEDQPGTKETKGATGSFERSPDVLDWLDANNVKLRRLARDETSDFEEPWKRAQKAEPVAFEDSGLNPDDAAEIYRRDTGKEISDEDFLTEVSGARTARQAALEAHKNEFGKLSQAGAFQAEAIEGARRGKEANVEGVGAEELAAGDRFTVGGEKVMVERVKPRADDETMIESVTVKDGPKFGTQVLRGDETLKIDAGSLERGASAPAGLEAWADRIIESARGRVSIGLDPELLAAYAVKGAAVLVRGVKDAGAWAAEMVRQYGEGIRKHLPEIRRRADELIEKGWQGADLPAALKPGQGERQFPRQADISTDVSNDVKLQQGPRLYDRRSNAEDARAAGEIIGQQGLENASQLFRSGQTGLHPAVESALGLELIKRWGLREQVAAMSKDAAAEKAAISAQLELIDAVARRSTDLAQGLQAMSMWQRLTPGGQIEMARRVIEGARAARLGGMRPALENIKRVIQEVNSETAGQVVNDRTVKAAAEAALEPMAHQISKTAAARRLAAELLNGKLLDVATAKGKEISELAGHHFAGEDPARTLQRKLWEDLKIPWKEAQVLARRVEKEFAKLVRAEAEKLFKESRRAVWQARQRQLLAMAEEHFNGNKSGRLLVDKVAEILKIDAKEAEKFAKILEERFAKLATEKKRLALRKLSLPTRVGPNVSRGLHEKLIELSNIGALDDASFDRAVSQKLGLPQWTRELAEEVKRRAEEIQKTPEGFQRTRKMVEMMNVVERAKGVRWWDLPMSFWFANILSGVTTHGMNIASTAANTAMSIGFEVARDPAGLPGILKAAADGLRKGSIEAREVLQTGIVSGTRLQKVEAMRALELRKFGGPAAFLNAWKYNFRAMAAEDLVFFKSAEEAHAYAAARMIAKRDGLTGEALEKRVREVMGWTDELKSAAAAQADREGLAGRDHARRVGEILEQQRPPEMIDNAKDFALRATFNEKPWGLMGALAQAVNGVAAKFPAVRTIVPFTNIVANVTNEALNYFPPVGVARAAWGTWRGELEGKPITDRTALTDQWGKAVAGTAALTALGILAARQINSGNPQFMVNGAGPRTPDQKKQLMETGWIPYSVKIGDRYVSYAWTPAAIGLAVLGNYLDAVRYKHLDKTDLMNRVAYALTASGRVIVEQSFLSGISDFIETLNRDSTKRGGETAMRSATRTASSFVIPNLVKQVDRIFDPIVYDAKTLEANLVASVPWVRRLNRPSINVLGEPVKNYVSSRFVSEARGDAIWNTIAQKQAWVSTSDRDTLLRGRPMSDDQYYRYVQLSGLAIRRRLMGSVGLIRSSPPDKARSIVDRIVEEERARAKRQM